MSEIFSFTKVISQSIFSENCPIEAAEETRRNVCKKESNETNNEGSPQPAAHTDQLKLKT